MMRTSLRPKRENVIYNCAKCKRNNADIWNIYDFPVITEMQMKILRLTFLPINEQRIK